MSVIHTNCVSKSWAPCFAFDNLLPCPLPSQQWSYSTTLHLKDYLVNSMFALLSFSWCIYLVKPYSCSLQQSASFLPFPRVAECCWRKVIFMLIGASPNSRSPTFWWALKDSVRLNLPKSLKCVMYFYFQDFPTGTLTA